MEKICSGKDYNIYVYFHYLRLIIFLNWSLQLDQLGITPRVLSSINSMSSFSKVPFMLFNIGQDMINRRITWRITRVCYTLTS